MRKLRTWVSSSGAALAFGGLALVAAPPAHSDVIVRVTGPTGPVAVGQSFDVTIAADLSDPVLGWGLDLGYDPALLQPVAAPAIASPWIAFGGGDGDGLGGVQLGPAGIAGDDIVLATLTFEALAQGAAALMLGVTPSDLNEGFALDPSGYDPNVTFVGALVTIVPEPGSGLLLTLGLVVLARERRGGPTRPRR